MGQARVKGEGFRFLHESCSLGQTECMGVYCFGGREDDGGNSKEGESK